MAADRISTILSVELDAAKVAQELEDLSRQIANVKNEQKQLDSELKEGKISASDYAKSTAAMKDELSWLQKQQKGVIATQKALTAETDTYSDSLNGQRQKLADMQKTYDQLTQSQRESAAGQQFLKALQEQTEVVKELEAETGRFQRNVGNYPRVIQSIIPGFDRATAMLSKIGISLDDLRINGTKAFAGLGASLKTFGKAFLTPPVAIITAVLGTIMFAVQKVSEAFKKNDNAMTALQKAFAVFEPIGQGVAKVFDWVAEGLAKVAEGAAKVVSWIAGKLSPAYAEAASAAQELVQAQDDLQESERQYTVNSAKRSAEAAELRNKAMQAAKYSVEQRKKYLEEAIALEKQNLADEKANAAERLRILEETAKKESDTSDVTKDKIAQARAAMYQAEEAYYTGTRRLMKQLTDFEAEERQKRVEAWEQEWRNKVLIAEANAETLKAQFEDVQAAAQAMLSSLDESEEENVPTPDEMARNMFGLDAEGVEYFRSLLNQGIEYGDAKTQALANYAGRMASAWSSAAGKIGGMFGDMANALEYFADENDDAAKAQKAFALSGILLNQAQSISAGALATAEGIKSAAGIPFPANIPAIISVVAQIGSMIAGVMSTIGQAKQIFAQADAGKFAEGGIVGGNSYTGDKMIAHVNSGEAILTQRQQAKVFDMLNAFEGTYASVPARLGDVARIVREALVNMPAPVMDYSEFETFKGNVATYDEFAKI